MSQGFSKTTTRQLQAFTENVTSNSDPTIKPLYAVVAGSQLYGFEDAESDIDVRGVHCVDGVRYTLLDDPASSIERTGEVTNTQRPVELESHELRSFGRQVAESDFNAIELLVAPHPLLNHESDLIEQLREIVRSHLPLKLPVRYRGLARSMLHNHIQQSEATVKHYLYGLRGALAARYVTTEESIEPNLQTLSGALLATEGQQTIDRLIEYKRTDGDRIPASTTATAAEKLLEDQLAKGEDEEYSDEYRESLWTEIDEWMLQVREKLGAI